MFYVFLNNNCIFSNKQRSYKIEILRELQIIVMLKAQTSIGQIIA